MSNLLPLLCFITVFACAHSDAAGQSSDTDKQHNLVLNGDFSAGDAGFTTGYGHPPFDYSAPGYYIIGDDSKRLWGWPQMAGHNGGNMLVVDGSRNAGIPFWCETVQVRPNTDYTFAFWGGTIALPQPSYEVRINGQVAGTFAPDRTLVWQEFNVRWASGDNDSAAICLFDLNLTWYGNDFAIDDISFLRSGEKLHPRQQQTAMEEPAIEPRFSVSASAATDELIINVESGKYDSYTITDVSNSVLISGPIKAAITRVDVSKLNVGWYYLLMKNTGKVETARFVKE